MPPALIKVYTVENIASPVTVYRPLPSGHTHTHTHTPRTKVMTRGGRGKGIDPQKHQASQSVELQWIHLTSFSLSLDSLLIFKRMKPSNYAWSGTEWKAKNNMHKKQSNILFQPLFSQFKKKKL